MSAWPTSCSWSGDGVPPPGAAPGARPSRCCGRSQQPGRLPVAGHTHQLRHTFGTSLINAGMSLPALMALMGHVTPEMTLRYAKLASPTVRTAYQAAMDKVRVRQPCRCWWMAARWCPTGSSGWVRRCSRPASPTAIAPATRWPKPAPTPTSASSATTSSPPPSSCPHSSTSSPMCAPSATTPRRAAGTQRQPATPRSSPASRATCGA